MKSLVTITTCNRLSEIRKYIWDYIRIVNKNKDYQFLLALDGKEQVYLDFCNFYEIPLLYSDCREGVGISKNRVLTQFPDFDYYFFIEDDVEILDSKAFDLFIETYLVTGYHHFTFSHEHNPTKIETKNNVTLIHNNFGGGQINFYSKEGLKEVGGWHTYFSKYKRFGHTEHTYRFYFSGLTPSPFIFIKEVKNMFIIHDPPHVTKIDENVINSNQNELIEEEQKMIDDNQKFVPLKTISAFHFNGFDMDFNKKVDNFLLRNKGRYPLSNFFDKIIGRSNFYFFKFSISTNCFEKSMCLFLSFILYPFNSKIKHFIKKKIF